MKIALIGNMNNNNFSLLRYFRDLGADAHLLLNTTDGRGSFSHFRPEDDCWDIEPWEPFIHQTIIPNGPVSAFESPLSYAIELGSKALKLQHAIEGRMRPVSRSQLRNAYSGYDCLIGSGTSPAALQRIGRTLNVFYSYANGIEFLNEPLFNKQCLMWHTYIPCRMLRRRQLKGLLQTPTIVCNNPGSTESLLSTYHVACRRLHVPMVYNRENIPINPTTPQLATVLEQIRLSKISLLHHARLNWARNQSDSDSQHDASSKNSDWLIRGFAQLVNYYPEKNPRLFILEYGQDVDKTKQLVHKLGVGAYITWLPKMSRRNLMWILSKVTIGVGEFYSTSSTIWGGTGWETLASCKPLLQGFHYKENEFEETFGFPQPPMLEVRNQEDIIKHLLFAAEQPEKCSEIGIKAGHWFNTYNGIALADKWLKLAMDSCV